MIRDTLYIDGGNLAWTPGMSDGSYEAVIVDNEPDGNVYTLSFGTAFSYSENITQKITPIPKLGSQAASNIAPLYYQGALFYNDFQFMAYGGLLVDTDAFELPGGDVIFKYEKYDDDTGRAFQEQGAFTIPYDIDGDNVTRWIAYGGSASAPSEKKGWYFSGLMARGKGELFSPAGVETDPAVLADSLITVDMTRQTSEKWTNTTLPPEVVPRISPELAFVPVGGSGILVVIGGVPETASVRSVPKLNDTQKVNVQTQGKEFLATIPVYDIASSTWYLQETYGTPPPHPLSEFCSVVASTDDGSTHNIYIYGGTSGYGLPDPTNFYDDVYVLSLPTFTWIPVAPQQFDSTSTVRKARAGHKCVKPWPDTMLVIGGTGSQEGFSTNCLPGEQGAGIFRGFNLNTLEWEEEYSLEGHAEFYQVPQKIFAEIGGNGVGGGRTSPDSWTDPGLAAVFSVRYDMTRIKDWSPYNSAAVGEPDPTRPDAPEEEKKSGTPKWLAPVLGTVLGLVFITALAVAVILYRRRKYFRRRQSEAGTSEVNRNRIMSWVKNGGLPDPKSPTVTSDSASHREGEDSDYGVSSSGGRVRSATNFTERSMSPLSHSRQYSDGSIEGAGGQPIQEAGGTMIYEMDATDRAQEMSAIESGTGFSFVGRNSALKHSQSVQSQNTVMSDGSDAISPSEEGTGTWGSDGLMSPSTPRPDSPTEGTSSNAGSIGRLSPNSAEGGTGTPKVKRKSAFGEHFDDK